MTYEYELTKPRRFKKITIIKINNFLDFCTIKIKKLPPNQQKLMRLYMVYANRILLKKPISQTQVNNLLTYINLKMRIRKTCPFTGNYCLSDFPEKINPSACKEEGPCILLT